jgi:hypothetical protein
MDGGPNAAPGRGHAQGGGVWAGPGTQIDVGRHHAKDRLPA